MRAKTDLFQINGQPMLVPDGPVGTAWEDLDSADSGRDESGVMHRIPVRYKVGVWSFSYSHLTTPELQYLESLFPEAGEFDFTHPSRLDPTVPAVTKAYRSRYSADWVDALTGLWGGYGFQIIEC